MNPGLWMSHGFLYQTFELRSILITSGLLIDEECAHKTSSISFKTSISRSNRSKFFSIESQTHGVTRPDAFLLLVSHKFDRTYM